MASIYSRGKRWWISYYLDGKHVRRPIGRSKRLAERAKKEVELKIEKKELDPPVETINLKEFIQEYIAYRKKTNIASNTLALDTYSFNSFLKWTSKTRLTDITRKDIDEYQAELGARLKPKSVANYVNCLQTALKKAIDWNYLKENPVKGVLNFKKTKNPPRFLKQEEITRLLNAAQHNGTRYMSPLIATAVFAGLRKSELINLEWTDVDFKNETITIRNKEDAQLKDKEFRAVPLNKKLKEILSPLRKKDGYCFLNSDNKRISNNLLRDFKRIASKAKVKEGTLHTLRHTFASQLAMAGVSLYKIGQWLGHSDPKTTMIYAHLQSSDEDINRI